MDKEEQHLGVFFMYIILRDKETKELILFNLLYEQGKLLQIQHEGND